MPQIFKNGMEDIDVEVTPNQDKDLGYDCAVTNGDSGSMIWKNAPAPQMYEMGIAGQVDKLYVQDNDITDATDVENSRPGQPDDQGVPSDFMSNNGEKGYFSLTKGTTDGAVN